MYNAFECFDIYGAFEIKWVNSINRNDAILFYEFSAYKVIQG